MLRLLLVLLLAVPVYAGQKLVLVHPAPESSSDFRYRYYWLLLDAALKSNVRQFGAYEIRIDPVAKNTLRIDAEIAGASSEVNIIVRAANPERDLSLLPVKLPLDKGLLGYRVFLIDAAMQKALNQVQTLDELKAFSIGQQAGWYDVNILRNAGFRVETAPTYDALFRMLGGRRFDLFSRGVVEVLPEKTAWQDKLPNLAIEETLLLYYPLPRYFYLRRDADGARIAHRIEDGLQRIAKSGEFERLYRQFKQESLAGLNLKGRKLFRLSHSDLQLTVPINNRQWWDDLSAELAVSGKR